MRPLQETVIFCVTQMAMQSEASGDHTAWTAVT